MDQEPIFQPSQALAKRAHIDASKYEALYAESIANPDGFWAEHGKRIDWIKPYRVMCPMTPPIFTSVGMPMAL